MRADRLITTLLLMQARGQVTASELSSELGISVSTARRDLEALSMAGVPVYAQPGRGGGWSLVGGAKTDLSGLTASEAQALFMLIGPTASLASEAKSALQKLMHALPATFRDDAAAAAGSVINDPARWGEHGKERPDRVLRLQEAIVRHRRIQLAYTSWAGEQTDRLVDPLGLINKDTSWYLIGNTDEGQRTFRVDRIVRFETTNEESTRPAGFELSEEWASIVDAVEEQRGRVSATIVIGSADVPSLRRMFGRQLEVESPIGVDPVRVRLSAPTAEIIAWRIAGWGARIEVIEPSTVREELARLGAELTHRYVSLRKPP